MKKHVRCFLTAVVCTLLLSNLSLAREEVSHIRYRECVSDLNGETVRAPHGTVAQSREVTVDLGRDTTLHPSIFFVIDNSGSMWLEEFDIGGETFTHMDPFAHRYTVTRDLIDSIHSRIPEAEVGIGVYGSSMYIDTNDDNLLASADPSSRWGYIPLLRLDTEYESDWAGRGTGRDILKSYMEIRDGVEPGYQQSPLVYRSRAATGTNITTAFDAARHAFENTNSQKSMQFIVFISDGDATIPEDDQAERERFIEGNDLPSTYTIFFRSDGQDVPVSIETMTENIRNNGYSLRNPDSRYYAYDNTSKDELLRFMMDNIISVIDQDIDVKDLIIEGDISHGEWDGEKVVFDELFPLTGDRTPFEFEFNYTLIDSMIIDDIDTIVIEDSLTLESDYTIELEDGFVIDEEYFEIQSWRRDIGFYDGGRELNLISLLNTDVELRFTEEAVDIFYGYSDVEIEVRSLTAGDQEVYSTVQSGNEFSSDMVIDHEGGGSSGDGILQVDVQDTIIAVFRNPRLPLDTIETKIPFDAGTLVTLTGAEYYDRSGDGFIDSVYAAFDITGELTDAGGDEIISLLTIAPDRHFTVRESQWSQDGLALEVEEALGNSNRIPRTHIMDMDTLSLEAGVLSDGGIVYQSTVTAEDKVAPVILSEGAWLYEYYNVMDTVVIDFSEPTAPITQSGDPFRIRREDAFYDMFLTPVYQKEHVVTFSLDSVMGVSQPRQGDSLRIHNERTIISDPAGNVQTHPENVERKLQVRSPVYVDQAAYFDATGDGFIDSIRISIHGGASFFDLPADIIEKAITLPDYRNFTVLDISVENETVILSVDENHERPRTFVTDDDILSLDPRQGGEEFFDDISTVRIRDSLAPVVAPEGGILFDNFTEKNVVEVYFSEAVSVSEKTGTPHLFKIPSGEYEMTLTQISVDGMTVRFAVEESTRNPQKEWNDSLWIHHGVTDIIRDQNGLHQDNPRNVRRPLKREISVGPASGAYFDAAADGIIDSGVVQLQSRRRELALPTGIVCRFPGTDHRVRVEPPHIHWEDAGDYENTRIVFPIAGFEDINTGFEAQDYITLEGDGYTSSVFVEDSLAPVIYTAEYYAGEIHLDGGKNPDTLAITFSEKLTGLHEGAPDTEPLFTLGSTDDAYTGDFTFHAQLRDSTYAFLVENLQTRMYPSPGDSVWITVEAPTDIIDQKGNIQNNKNNRKVEMRVEKLQINVQLYGFWITDTDNFSDIESYEDFGRVIDDEEIDISLGGMIVIDPMVPFLREEVRGDNFDARVSILDEVGNVVVSVHSKNEPHDNIALFPLYYDNRWVMAVYWDGTNSHGRRVHARSYKVLAQTYWPGIDAAIPASGLIPVIKKY
jgi:hypothetical protein